MDDNEAWVSYVGQRVIVDTNSSFVYVGTLEKVLDHFVVLRDADVHDRGEGPSTKEQYVMDCKRLGVNANRKEVSVRKSLVVSLSRLEDVILY